MALFWTFNGKLKRASGTEDLKILANRTKNWTDKQERDLINRADNFVCSAIHAGCLIREIARDSLRHKLISHFAKKFSIYDFEVLDHFLMAIEGDEFLAQQAQRDVIAAAEHLLKISEGCHLGFLADVARRTYKMIPFSEEQEILEESIVDAALPQFKSVEEMLEFTFENFYTVSGICSMLAGYVLDGHLKVFRHSSMLLKTIRVNVLDVNENQILFSTRLAIYGKAAEILARNGSGVSLDQLKEFAGLIHDHANDGLGSKEIENAVISTALRKISSTAEVAEMTNFFGTRTGVHRLLLKYIEKISCREKPLTQGDVEILGKLVRTFSFGGEAVVDALEKLARKQDLKFSKREVINRMLEDLSQESEAMIGLGGLFSTFVEQGIKSDGIEGGCPCPNCQIKRLIQKDPENNYLLAEWEAVKRNLEGEGFLFVSGEKKYMISAEKLKDLETTFERYDVSDILRDVLRKAFVTENAPRKFVLGSGGSSSVTTFPGGMMITISQRSLEN